VWIIQGSASLRQSYRGSLCCVNPTLHVDPNAASPLLEPVYLAKNGNTFATWAMPDNAWGGGYGTWCGSCGINPALNATAITGEIIRAVHAVYCCLACSKNRNACLVHLFALLVIDGAKIILYAAMIWFLIAY
jgi:hypothetical protein